MLILSDLLKKENYQNLPESEYYKEAIDLAALVPSIKTILPRKQ